MENRILINGEWYVRESTLTETPIVITTDEITFSKDATYETETSCWEASMIYKDYEEDELYNGFTIEYTDKAKWTADRTDAKAIEYWDNESWLRGIMEGDEDSLKVIGGTLSKSDVEHFRAFLRKLEYLGWFD